MKKITIVIVALLIGLNSQAQFKLSGRVLNAAKPDSMTINIPFIYGVYVQNNITIPVDNKGNFNTTIRVSEQKFVMLTYHGLRSTLLLTPGKSVSFDINSKDTLLNNFKGSAAEENQLLFEVKMNQTPFFLKTVNGKNPYAAHTNEQDVQTVVKPWLAMRDDKISKIQLSQLSPKDKSLIIQEIKAEAIVQLNYFARSTGRSKVNLTSFLKVIHEGTPIVPEVLPAGPMFYHMADVNISYLDSQVFTQLEAEKGNNKQPILKFYNITLDSGNRVAKEKGKGFLNWMAVRNTYDKRVAEAYLAQAIATEYYEKELAQATPLLNEMKATFPKSKYLPELVNMVDDLKSSLAKNQNNTEIHIAEGYEKMTSIYQAIAKLKGKVVYLDIWGTWCAPCKEELVFNPELKHYFKGRDVAFVYLDMDDDAKDQQWREFIKVNGMTGLHLRKSNSTIQQFWAELMPGQDLQRYPTYFIFDKNGKLVQAGAKRPSEKAELYKQLEQYL